VSRAQGPGSAADDYGHGTAVSGVVTSAGTLAPLGGAPAADVVAVKVMDSTGHFANISDPFAALDWVTNERPDVDLVNMSFGTNPIEGGDCDANLLGIAFAYWTDQLRADGVLSFAASHNQGLANAMSSPACVAGVISVGAVYENGTGDDLDDQITDFSNTSETTDLLAPGSATTTTSRMSFGGVGTWWGTSFSTPLALACAATLLEANPGLAPDLLEAALESSSTRIFDPRNGFDYPRVDCEEAHAYVRGACADALDNDRDGASDLDDAGCPFPESRPENPVCNDGLDNDGDGLTDFDDPNCSPTWPYSERRACGLGAELALLGVLAPFLAMRKRARSASA
jgi:hypothetical protein